MADLSDCFHYYGQDLGLTPNGDVALATKSQRTVQRIIRRFMTSPTNQQNGSSYPWEPTYGVGLGRRIGQALDVRGLQADIRSQMLLEPAVAKSPGPSVQVGNIDNTNGTVTITISYYDLSGQPRSFSFNLTGITILNTESGSLIDTDTGFYLIV